MFGNKLVGVWLQLLPPPQVAEEIRAAAAFAQRLTGGALHTEKAGPPHVTLVFLGDVSKYDLAEMKAQLRYVCARLDPVHVRAERFGHFPPSEASKGKIPVILRHQSTPTLLACRDACFGVVQNRITAPQFPEWHPHSALGTLPPGGDSSVLDGIDAPPIAWTSDRVHLACRGEVELDSFPLLGVR